ncbi:MAG: secretin and TonB N-terminal domain-containing protein [Planctomycetota bacterium]|jgi:type IV pilus assembly protein PilQ|nr:secretin and TonB N-terminal domain-containing protein [Planctomycetota bacterium]MDP7246408.1 secretin and TonB N-terminal domain-containing protein [Planctomycetota bacterium]
MRTILLNVLTAAALALAAPAISQDSPTGSDETVTVNFHDQPLASVLEMFSSNYGLNLVYGPDIEGKVTLNLFEAPVREALNKILAANGFQAVEEGGFVLVVPASSVSGQDEVVASPWEPRVLFLNHMRAKDVEPMLSPLLSGDEQLILGPESKSGLDQADDLGGNEQATREMLILLAREETNARVDALLAKLDIPPQQVLVEATILSVSLNDTAKLGVDFTALGGIDFQAMGGTSNITNSYTGGTAEGAQLDNWLLGFSQTGFTDSSSGGLHMGILKNQVGIFIQALEDVGNATVLSNPQVLTLNRHAAQVLVGKKIGYQTTTTTQTSTVQSVEFLEVGTSLVFRPFISDDGYVRMEIHPENSDGNINPTSGLPEESTTEVSTNILVRSGHTVVIGGLMENAVATTTSQIPFLGSLPYLGSLFRSESESESKNEIIVMLTPHIVDDQELDSRAGEAAERWRLAQSRLAASHHGYLRPSYARKMYAEAGLALAAGQPELALAKAEWGLAAMPADADLAALAKHCEAQLREAGLELEELKNAVELLEELGD